MIKQGKRISIVDFYKKKYTIDESELIWRPAAYAIIIKDKKLLLSKEDGKYSLPGGGVDIGEMPEEALIREVKEETGIIVKNVHPLSFKSVYFMLDEITYMQPVQSLLLYYTAEYKKGDITLDYIPEVERPFHGFAEWVDLDAIRSIEITSNYDWRELIKEVR